MLRVTESVHTEPTMISQLVRMAMLQILLQPVWEGLANHQWTDGELAALDAELGKLDFLADYHFSMRVERTFAVGIIDYVRRSRTEIENETSDFNDDERAFDSSFKFQMHLARFGPGGWFEQNKVACCRMNFDVLVPIVNRETRVVSPIAAAHTTNAWKEVRLTPCNWLTRLFLPALGNASPRFARAQASTDMARIACALERYRLAHGNFPETLDALTPQFMEKIPHDVIGGKPLHYRRTSDGQFLLYSVGWNETDDGGKVGLAEKGNVDWKQGDWVWRYPAN